MEALLPPAGDRRCLKCNPLPAKFSETLRVHFFYLNVGRPEKAYIVRVELPAWVAGNPEKIERLQNVLLEQCRVMSSRPYPYLLHRAHEEAVVHYDEKEQLQRALLQELQNKA
jgi:NurA-like 5'-3' nuclease